MIYDFVALDFETASSDYHSACSLGLVFVKNSKVIDTKYYLIKPPGEFLTYNSKVHGLTKDDVKTAPTFNDIWPEIRPLINNSLLIAHAAKFDINVLTACCHFYQLPLPHFQYIDSIDLFRAAYPTHQKASLDYCAKLLDISLENHHHAMEDATACAQIAIKSVKKMKRMHLPQMIAAFKKIDVKTSDIIVTLTNLDKKHPLYGEKLVLSGSTIPVKGHLKFEYQTEAMTPLPKENE